MHPLSVEAGCVEDRVGVRIGALEPRLAVPEDQASVARGEHLVEPLRQGEDGLHGHADVAPVAVGADSVEALVDVGVASAALEPPVILVEIELLEDAGAPALVLGVEAEAGGARGGRHPVRRDDVVHGHRNDHDAPAQRGRVGRARNDGEAEAVVVRLGLGLLLDGRGPFPLTGVR